MIFDTCYFPGGYLCISNNRLLTHSTCGNFMRSEDGFLREKMAKVQVCAHSTCIFLAWKPIEIYRGKSNPPKGTLKTLTCMGRTHHPGWCLPCQALRLKRKEQERQAYGGCHCHSKNGPWPDINIYDWKKTAQIFHGLEKRSFLESSSWNMRMLGIHVKLNLMPCTCWTAVGHKSQQCQRPEDLS